MIISQFFICCTEYLKTTQNWNTNNFSDLNKLILFRELQDGKDLIPPVVVTLLWTAIFLGSPTSPHFSILILSFKPHNLSLPKSLFQCSFFVVPLILKLFISTSQWYGISISVMLCQIRSCFWKTSHFPMKLFFVCLFCSHTFYSLILHNDIPYVNAQMLIISEVTFIFSQPRESRCLIFIILS